MSRRVRAAWLAAALAFVASAAWAHQEPYSYLDVRVTGDHLEGRLIAHVVDLAHETGLAVPESLFDAGFAARHREALEQVLTSHLRLTADGRAIEPTWGALDVVRERRSLGFAWTARTSGAPASIELASPLFPYDPPHETYVNVYVDGALRHQDLLDHGHPSGRWATGLQQSTAAVIRTFVLQGIHHIFIGPDHILFVVGLLLLGGGIARLLKVVTAFTVAHTVTLVLATLRIVDPSPRIVEPLIALSIVAIGVETLLALRSGRDVRGRLAFGFGFVHGFGFAGVLREFGLPPAALGWSLASFNVGVEIGQACIVLAVAPLLGLLRSRRPQLAGGVVTGMASVIIAAGGYWFVERVLAR